MNYINRLEKIQKNYLNNITYLLIVPVCFVVGNTGVKKMSERKKTL